MTFMVWSEALSVGIDKIDEQHHWLLDATNRLYDEIDSGQATPASMVVLLEALMDYTMNHFIAEEELFDRYGYPEAEAHKALHGEFTGSVMRLLLEVEVGGEVGPEVLELLKNWLVKHIMKADKAYVPFLVSCGETLSH